MVCLDLGVILSYAESTVSGYMWHTKPSVRSDAVPFHPSDLNHDSELVILGFSVKVPLVSMAAMTLPHKPPYSSLTKPGTRSCVVSGYALHGPSCDEPHNSLACSVTFHRLLSSPPRFR